MVDEWMKEQKSPWKNGSIDGSIGGRINGDRMYGKRQSRWMYRWLDGEKI